MTGVRERPEAAEVYTGVAAPKRKKVEELPVVAEIPKVCAATVFTNSNLVCVVAVWCY